MRRKVKIGGISLEHLKKLRIGEIKDIYKDLGIDHRQATKKMLRKAKNLE